MRLTSFLAATLLLAGNTLANDDCRYTAGRRVSAPAAGVTRVVVHGSAGSLHVDGRQGVTEILAAGTACTSDKDFLEDIVLTARRSGSELHIEAHVPEKKIVFGWWEARLDFGVVVPFGIAVEVEDGSGWTKVTNTGNTKIEDGSGSLTIGNIRGDLEVSDGSGELTIDGVTGNATIEDGSGELTVRNVAGNVEVDDQSGAMTLADVQGNVLVRDDGSGAIDIRNIRRNVTIDDDGSGGIDAADIGGNFVVHRKGSGNVNHVRVAGKVSVPRD